MLGEAVVTRTRTLDPDLVAIVRAMGLQAAREDHRREQADRRRLYSYSASPPAAYTATASLIWSWETALGPSGYTMLYAPEVKGTK